jgi:hypothetical protein
VMRWCCSMTMAMSMSMSMSMSIGHLNRILDDIHNVILHYGQSINVFICSHIHCDDWYLIIYIDLYWSKMLKDLTPIFKGINILFDTRLSRQYKNSFQKFTWFYWS